MDCKEKLTEFFNENGVSFQEKPHPKAYTMQEVAAALGIPGRQVAKVVIVRADDKLVMLVVPAPYRINFARLGTVLNAKKVSLSSESEFADRFPDCAPGAMPPFGHFYELSTYVDRSVTEEPFIYFRVGTHNESFMLSYPDYAKLAQPAVEEFAYLA